MIIQEQKTKHIVVNKWGNHDMEDDIMQFQLPHTITRSMAYANLFSVVFIPERIQCESRDLQNPSTVHVTVSTGQVTV